MDKRPVLNKQAVQFSLFVFIIIICWILGRYYKFDIDAIRAILSRFPVGFSGVIFIFLYVILTNLFWFGPKDILRITGAIFFGATISSIFVWIAELINAFLLFHVSRNLGQGYVMQRFPVKSHQLEGVKKDTSMFWVLALRSNPLVPFRVMDLGFGLTSMSFVKYFTSIFIVSLLRIFWLQYILAGVGEGIFQGVSVMRDYLMNNPFLIVYSFLYFFTVFVLTIIAFGIRFIRGRNKKGL